MESVSPSIEPHLRKNGWQLLQAINSPIGEGIPLSILQDPEIHH